LKRSLNAWVSVAEIVSGVAVVVTLIFLIFGIRENTNVTRASAYQSSIDGLISFESLISQDAELSEIWFTYIIDGAEAVDGLQELQRRRLNLLITQLFRNYEKAYFAERYDLLGKSEWDRYERSVCLHYDRAQSIGVLQFVRGVTSDVFAEFLEDTCSDQRVPDLVTEAE
jgi:hypothetical protein